MEISYTLIVALMYVTIISFGLAGLLSSLSTILQKANSRTVCGVQLHWILILLIVHFNMTWHAVYLTGVESWTYFGFIAVVFGPILGFFTANFLSPNTGGKATKNDSIENYLSIKTKIISLFLAIQLWTLIIDRVIGRGFVESAYFNFGLIGVSLYMLLSKKYTSQQYGIAIIWTLLLVAIALRASRIIE
ncbi:MAG: hypothetical protein R3182_02545 [Draconibacterium sp.]|nr:hypothetical protein [Draconibacterium sp.]